MINIKNKFDLSTKTCHGVGMNIKILTILTLMATFIVLLATGEEKDPGSTVSSGGYFEDLY